MRPITLVLMLVAEAGHRAVCEGEEAASHYREAFTRWDAWCNWWTGFSSVAFRSPTIALSSAINKHVRCFGQRRRKEQR